MSHKNYTNRLNKCTPNYTDDPTFIQHTIFMYST